MAQDHQVFRTIRDLKVAVVHPDDEDGQALVRQLKRIGCAVHHYWPPPNHIPADTDTVLFWIDQERPSEQPWLGEDRIFALVAILGFENPTVLDSVVKMNVHGTIAKPIRPFGILATLAIARTLFRYEKRLIDRIDKLDETLKTRRTVEKATRILSAQLKVSEEEAYVVIRQESMNKQIPLSSMAEAILNADGIISLVAPSKDGSDDS